jgi:hypothetical protein
MSLFSRLLRLHKRSEQSVDIRSQLHRSPEEDFFTEIIGHLGETEPAILFDWLNNYAFPRPRQFTSLRISTQKRFPPPAGFNIESKLDFVMELERDGLIDLVFIESKIKAKEGFEQLPRYCQTLAEQNVTGEKWLLYVTRNFEPKRTNYHQRLAAINFKQLRWFQFYKALRRQKHNPIIKEVLAFMEETGMSQGNRFSARDALTIQNLATATSLMDATLADEIEELFEQITSKPKWNYVYDDLGQMGRYMLFTGLGNTKWWCGLGYYPSTEDDFPLVGLTVEIDPACKERTAIVAAMKNAKKANPAWEAYNLDQPNLWGGIRQRKSLTAFLGEEDNVAAIRVYFAKLLEDLKKFKGENRNLPWS